MRHLTRFQLKQSVARSFCDSWALTSLLIEYSVLVGFCSFLLFSVTVFIKLATYCSHQFFSIRYVCRYHIISYFHVVDCAVSHVCG